MKRKQEENIEKEPVNKKKLPKPKQTLQMQGNVILKTTQGNIISDNVVLDLLKQHATLEGLDTNKEGRIRVEANLSDLEKKRSKKECGFCKSRQEFSNDSNSKLESF